MDWKNSLPFSAKWLELEHIMLSEISQTQKDKYCMFSLCVKAKKRKKSLCISFVINAIFSQVLLYLSSLQELYSYCNFNDFVTT